MTDEGATLFGNAIIKQAADDYRNAYLGSTAGAKHEGDTPEDIMKDVEKFFHDNWYEFFTDIDPDWLLREIKAQALKDTIEAYDYILNLDHNVQINFTEKKGKGNKLVFTYTVPPNFKDDFCETVRCQREELKKELKRLYGRNNT